jgi:hypothetical protein
MKNIHKMSDRELRLEVAELRVTMEVLQGQVERLRMMVVSVLIKPPVMKAEQESFMTLYPGFDYRSDDAKFVKPMLKERTVEIPWSD